MPLHIQEPAIKNHIRVLGLLCSSDGKESACNAGDLNSITGSGRPFLRREWQPTPIFLAGEFYEQISLVGCSPWGCKESGMTKQLTLRLLQVTQDCYGFVQF